MAVNSSKKKKRNKSLQNLIDENINNKTVLEDNTTQNDNKIEKDKIIEDAIILEDNTNDIELKDDVKEEEDIDKVVSDEIVSISISNKKRSILLFIIILFFTVFICYILMPKIILTGDSLYNITYNENYIEPGYKAIFMFKNVTNSIKVNNEVVNGKVGSYKVIYTYKLGFINFKKIRTVNVIDNKKPQILIDDDVSICPNDDISKVKYEVIDEYDGNITDKVTSKYIDNKLIITATDSSNNKNVKEVNVKKEDLDKPVIKLNGEETIYLNYGASFSDPGYEVNDNCDNSIKDKVKVTGSVGNSVGTYKINYSVTDDAGNTSEVTRTVIVKNNYLYNSGTIGNGTIYLTFDDGPSNGITNVILDVLKEEGVKATFFVTCNGPDSLIKRIYDEGHTVALHTATHNYSYIYSSVDNYFEDLNRVSNRVKNITGIESKIIRFPGGSSNTISRNFKKGIMTELTSLVLNKGYRYFDWNVDSNDAGGAKSSSDVYNNVVSHLSKNRSNVVLMHDIKYTTRDAIRNIIKYGKANGYNFDKINMDTYMVRHGVNN